MNKEMWKKFVEEPSVDKWFADWLQGEDIPADELGDFKRVEDTQWESKAATYEPFCLCFQPALRVAGGEYAMLATGNHPEPSFGESDIKADLSLYRKGGPGEDAFALSDKEELKESLAAASDTHKHTARTAWPWITALIEVRTDITDSPFVHNTGRVTLNNTAAGINACAQITTYAAELQRRQHRTFVYTACVVRNLVWLMRWDRAGAVVARAFDYLEHPQYFFNFIYRIARASPEAQGYDTSATLVDETSPYLRSFEAYQDTLMKGSWYYAYANEILSSTKSHPIYEVKCPDIPELEDKYLPNIGIAERTYTYLIGKPLSASLSPVGRGSKAFVAYDVDRKRLVFLKEYWRPDDDTVHSELETYGKLNKARVRHVATAIAGGDVEDRQVTRAQELMSFQSHRIAGAARRVHHRFVVLEIGRPLETYEDSAHLFRAVYDAFIAHCKAYELAGILHGDISMNNILIDIDTNWGFLSDWDLCKYTSELHLAQSQSNRSGTWPYMSGTLIQYPLKPNELADDLESFVYVFEVACLRFHPHVWTAQKHRGAVPGNEELARDAKADEKGKGVDRAGPNGGKPREVIFPSNTEEEPLALYFSIKFDIALNVAGGLTVGDPRKADHMVMERPGSFRLLDDNSPLAGLLRDLYKLGKEHYSQIDLGEYEKKWGPGALERHPQPQTGEKRHARDIDRESGFDNEGRKADQQVTHATTFANPPPAPPAAAALRDFKTHAHMSRLFEEYKEKIWPMGDKTPDQFEGLVFYERVKLGTSQVGGSGSSGASDASGLSTKKQKVTKGSSVESADSNG